ncbi:Rhodanese-like domain-containing protein [Rhizoctonia solani]|nr:Rhodanese-like domain-containing protein [Rhizoctonia solani]
MRYSNECPCIVFLAQAVMTPPTKPLGSKSIAQILADARSRLNRVSPELAQEASHARGALLIDIRPEAQRKHFGEIPGALIIERNVLEWRLDPQSDAHLTGVLGVGTYEVEPIVFCQEGYTSSLAAASLKDLGLMKATDMDGGFKAWKEAGLPTTGGGHLTD